MSWLQDLDPSVVASFIPVVAILGGFAYAITKAVIRHRERLAMIERGMHPDAPPESKAAGGRDGGGGGGARPGA